MEVKQGASQRNPRGGLVLFEQLHKDSSNRQNGDEQRDRQQHRVPTPIRQVELACDQDQTTEDKAENHDTHTDCLWHLAKFFDSTLSHGKQNIQSRLPPGCSLSV